MDERDQYYRVLELKPGASPEEIEQAYQDLLNIWDPARVASDPRLQEKANEKMKEINLAYEKLMEYLKVPREEASVEDGERRTGLEEQRTSDERMPQPPSETPTEALPDEVFYGAAKRKPIKKTYLFGGIVLILLAGAAVSYFFYFGNAGKQALAHVNGEKVTLEQFNKELSQMETPLRDMYKEEPDKFLEMVIVKRLLLQEAKKQALSVQPKTYKDSAKDATAPEEALIAELMKKKFSSPPAVSRQEVEAFYSMFKDRMGGKPLNEVAPVIEQLIREGKQQEELGQFMKELREKAQIDIDRDRLKKIAAKPPESNTGEEFKKAMASGKPVLVDFGANSCIPCRQMRPILKELGSQYLEKASILVIDIYNNQDLAREYQIQLIPTLVFFDSKGKEIFRHVGAWDKENIVTKLKEIGMGT